MYERDCKMLKDRTQSPAPTEVVSRFFNKPDELPPGTVVDAPPPKQRAATARGRPRTTRSVGQRDVPPVDVVSPEAEIIAALEAELPELMAAQTARDRPVSPSIRSPQPLSKEQQFSCYLGNCAPLMMHARERYGDVGTGGITTRQVRAWLKANPRFIPEHLRGIDFHVDHIVGDGIGGQNWPLNYFLMPKACLLYTSPSPRDS